jgi:hypothetical protein
MKKILLSFVLLAFSLTACDRNDPVVFDSYKILNNSSTEITIKSYSSVTGEIETIIPVNEIRPVDGYESTTPFPRSFEGDYCSISNGQKIITQRKDDNDGLYRESNYILIRVDNDGERTFLYVFTDDFFANGEPVE